MEELYTPQEVAKMLKVSLRAIYKWIHDGKLKSKKVGTLWRIPKDALEEFIEDPKKTKDYFKMTVGNPGLCCFLNIILN